MPTTPEVVQPTAMSHTGREEESARMFCRTREGLASGGSPGPSVGAASVRPGQGWEGLTFSELTHPKLASSTDRKTGLSCGAGRRHRKSTEP